MAETDRVVIAGAGPVGMCAALYLAERDIPVLVLEAGDSLAIDLRASTFHPPTLDLLDQFAGIPAELEAQGLRARHWQYRDRREGAIVTWDMDVLRNDTNHPYRLQTEQWKLTHLIQGRLTAYPHAELRFGHKVVGATPGDGRASVTVETPDGGTAEIGGRYVIGCDGANSQVRQTLGIEYEGLTFPELFLSISTTFEYKDAWPDLTYVNYIADPEEWLVLLRVVDAWRVLFPTALDEDRERALSDEMVQARLRTVVDPGAPFDVVHRTHYGVHQRVATTYRMGNILLAGDSAHINNPLGGMGMNGGIQDAFNLAEKLVRVWRGEDDSLLDIYETQRRAMALGFVQESTIRNREMLKETDPKLREERHAELRRIADDPARTREYLLRVSMIAALREYEQQEAA